MTVDLDPDAIHLWMTPLAEIRDASLLRRYGALLSDDERERQRRFRFDIQRRCHLVTRALVRTVLSRYEPVAPQDWRFTVNAHGRPAIAALHGRAARLSFNVSHTNSLILIGVTAGRMLGVDVEDDRSRRAPLEVADDWFARHEVRDLRALPEARQHGRFFEYWTLKESYVKARGMGMSIPLNRFGFHFPDEESVRFSIDRGVGDRPSRWRFWQFRPTEGCVAAVCSERGSSAVPPIVLRRAIPLAEESGGALHGMRRSEG